MNKVNKLNGFRHSTVPNQDISNSNDEFEDLNGSINKSPLTNFDIVPKLIESASLIDNQLLTPKLIKMFDSIQTAFDVQNQLLTENVPKMKESVLIDLARKSSDLTHRQQLQSLLITALNDNDLAKANLINSFLNPNGFQAQVPSSNNQTPPLNNYLDLFNQVNSCSNRTQQSKDNLQALTANESSMNNVDNNLNQSITELTNGDTTTTEHDQNSSSHNDTTTNNENQNNSFNNEDTIVVDKRIKPKLRASPLSPIRHLICSPGLEQSAHKYKIIVLYRGVCNGYCYANKPWSKQVHLHYIVNTVNCNDHISRLVKKQGIQFYNSFVLQSPERWNQLIQLYRMEKVKQNSFNM